MQIESKSTEEIVIRFSANPNTALAQQWTEEVRSRLTGKEKRVEIDLSQLRLVSSLLMGVVVKIFRSMEKQGGTIAVVTSSVDVRRVFEAFQLTTLFEVKVASA